MSSEESSPFDILPHRRTPDGWRLSPDGFYWHATTKDRLARIMREGLRSGRRARWSNRLGKKMGEGHLYVSSFFDTALKWAVKMQYDWARDDVVLIKITQPSAMEPDPCIESQLAGRTFWRTRAGVPPSGIVRVIPIDQTMNKVVVEAFRTNSLIREPLVN